MVREDSRVCMYCARVKITYIGKCDEEAYGCGLQQDNHGKYARCVFGPDEVEQLKRIGIGAVDMFVGCDKFSPNGASIHPENHARISIVNPLCGQIPIDGRLVDDPRGLHKRIEAALPSDAVVDFSEMQ